jgi:hypothetical protein
LIKSADYSHCQPSRLKAWWTEYPARLWRARHAFGSPWIIKERDVAHVAYCKVPWVLPVELQVVRYIYVLILRSPWIIKNNDHTEKHSVYKENGNSRDQNAKLCVAALLNLLNHCFRARIIRKDNKHRMPTGIHKSK